MIPLNTFTPDPELGDFLPPNNNDYYPLFQVVRGGTEIGNNSAGRDIQDWQVYYQQGIIYIKPNSGNVVFTLPVNDVLTVSLAFDTAMRVVLTWTTPLGAKLYFYDTLTLDYITVNYNEVTSSRVAVDKIDTWYNSSSDVLFLYVKNNNLYYRQQRDRYEIEYLIGPANGYIKRAGLTNLNRFQIDISEVQYAQTNINVLAGIYVPINLTGPIAQIPKCAITPNSLTVNEGDIITYTLVTEYISDGTILEFRRSGGSALDSDFDTPLNGTVTIQNNSGTFSLNVKNDILVEGTETIIMSLNISGKITTLAKSPEVTIVDTTPVPTFTPSSTPAVIVATYQITPNKTAVNEGEVITFAVNTTNVPNNTSLLYYISNSNASLTATDFKLENGLILNTSLSPLPLGYVVINNNFGNFNIKIANDIDIENTENFRINLSPIGGGIGNSIVSTNEITINNILDPTPSPTLSINPTYVLTSNTTNINEGDTVTYYLNTNNVPNGTVVYWGSDYGLVPHYNTVTGSDFGYPDNISIVATAGVTALTINNNYTQFSLTAANDLTTEGVETLAMTIRSSVPDGVLLARSLLVTVNDTSRVPTSTPAPALPTYSLTANTNTLIEDGSVVTFYINTTNVPDGTRLNYSTFENSSGLGWNDINWSSATSMGVVGNRQLANVAIYNNYATFTVWALQDNVSENQEFFKIQLTPYNGTEQLALSETIYLNNIDIPIITNAPAVATYSLSVNNTTTLTENTSKTYTITGTNIPNGTVVYWGSDAGLIPSYSSIESTELGFAYDNSIYPNGLPPGGTPIIINNNTATFNIAITQSPLWVVEATLALVIRSSLNGVLLARAPLVQIYKSDGFA